MWSSWPFIFSTLPLQDVRSYAQNSIPMAKVSARALSVLAFAASVMASPCFVAPRSPLSSPGQATSLHVKAEAAFKAETASTRWTSSGLVLPATLLAAGIGRRRQCRRHARSAKVVRQVIGPAVAAAAAAAKVAAAGKLAAAGGGAAAVAAGIKTLSKKRPTEHRSGERKKMVILGTGWGSVTFLQGLSEDIAKFYDITVVSWLSFFVWSSWCTIMYMLLNGYWLYRIQLSLLRAQVSPRNFFLKLVLTNSVLVGIYFEIFWDSTLQSSKNHCCTTGATGWFQSLKLTSVDETEILYQHQKWRMELKCKKKKHGITYQFQRDSSLHQQYFRGWKFLSFLPLDSGILHCYQQVQWVLLKRDPL